MKGITEKEREREKRGTEGEGGGGKGKEREELWEKRFEHFIPFIYYSLFFTGFHIS